MSGPINIGALTRRPSIGLPGPRPGGVQPQGFQGQTNPAPAPVPAPNISRAFAVTEGGSDIVSPEAQSQINRGAEVGQGAIGLTGGDDITGQDQIAQILQRPGRGLASRFEGGGAGSVFGSQEGGGSPEELLRSILGGF